MSYQSLDPSLTPQRKRLLVWFIVSIALVATVLCFALALDLENTRPLEWIPWWAVLLLSYLLERNSVYLEAQGQGSGHSLIELSIVIGLAALSPAMLIIARVAGVLAYRLVQMRAAPLKLCFNIALTWFEISLVLALLSLLPSGFDVTIWQHWAVLLLVLLLADLSCAALVSVAIAIATGERSRSFRPAIQIADSTAVAVSAVAAIMMTLAFIVYPASVALGLVLSGLLVITYRHHRQTLDRYGSLRQLMRQMDDNTVGIQGSGWHDVLRQMVMSFNARHAEILILPMDGDGQAKRYRFGDRNVETEARLAPGTDDMRRYRKLAKYKQAHFANPETLPVGISGVSASRECMVASLVLHGQTAGLLLLAGKSVGERAFTTMQLDQFGLFAGRISRAIEQDRLLQRIKEEAAGLRERMYVDQQTGLASESAFHEIMHRREDEAAVVAVIRPINITEVSRQIGREAGNAVLIELAGRLKQAIGENAQLFHHRSSGFILRIPGLEREAAENAVRDWLNSISDTFNYDGKKLYIEVHAGITHYPVDADNPDSLLDIAGLALDQAWVSHTPVTTYRAPADSDDLLGLMLKGDLADAIRNEDIELFFQPRVRLRDDLQVGAEALARWYHPEKGYIRPDVFIRVAEESGLILELSRLVLRKALAAVSAWRAAGYNLGVSVNLSAHDLREQDLCQRVRALLDEYNVEPHLVTLEITETTLMENIDKAVILIEELHAIGVTISIDDFGTGYSSFAYLARLPLDEIKIDRSFVSHMDKRGVDSTVVETIIQLGHKLGMTIVAEGVESGEVMSRLAALDCDQAQGYFIARPMDQKAFMVFVAQRPRALVSDSNSFETGEAQPNDLAPE